MESRQILVVTASRSLKRHITRALASASFDVHHAPPEIPSVGQALELRPDMCIVDIDEHQEEVAWLLDTLREKYPQVIGLLVSQDHEMPFLREKLEAKNLGNLIAKHGGVAATTSEIIDESELIVTCQKLFLRDIFGLDKYMRTWGIKIHEVEIEGTASKPCVMERLEQFLDQIDCYGAVKGAVLLVADELFMNAVFNAPRDAFGRPKYATWARDREVVLEPHERATFRFACDGRHVGISAKDQFGGLERDVILRYLKQSFTGGSADVEEKAGGAGLGLHMIFNSITQLVFNVEVGVATEVLALFYARSGSLAFKSSGRSLNIFYVE